MGDLTKSIKRYLPPKGMDATVLFFVRSPMGVSYILEKIIPVIFIVFASLLSYGFAVGNNKVFGDNTNIFIYCIGIFWLGTNRCIFADGAVFADN